MAPRTSAYALTQAQTAPAPSEQAAAGVATQSGPLTPDQIFLLLMGATSPQDLLEGGGALGPLSGFAGGAIAAEAAAHQQGPVNPDGSVNQNYYASGLRIGTSRYGDRTRTPLRRGGRALAQGEVMVNTDNLTGEAKSHALDPKWMSSHGYLVVTRYGPRGEIGEIQWMEKKRWEDNKDTLIKANYVPMQTWKDTQGRKLVSDDEIKGKGTIGSMAAMTTPTHLKMALYNMPADDLIKLQHKLWDGGYFQGESRPVWGTIDDATDAAYLAAMKDSLAHPSLTLDESIDAASKGTMATRRAQRLAKKAEVDASLAAGVNGEGIVSADTIRTITDRVATELTGRMLSPEEKEQLVGIVQGKDTADVQARSAAQRSSKLTEAGIVDDVELDRFVNLFAVQHAEQFPNVVGALGMRPREFQQWLVKLGMDPNTAFTPANERMVMKEMAADYFSQFGNWQDVAVAMLSGPSAGWSDISSGLAPAQTKGYGSSLNSKATEIARGFLGGLPTAEQQATTAGGAGAGAITERFDPDGFLTQELRRRHPTEITQHNLVGSGGLSDTFTGMLAKWGPGPGAGGTQ